MTNKDELILRIAKKHFRVETLEERKSDSLDFKDTAVWSMKDALEEAYAEGVKAGRKEMASDLARDR